MCMPSSVLYVSSTVPSYTRSYAEQAYFSAISELHMRQMKALLDAYVNLVKKGSDDDVVEQSEDQVACLYLC